MFLLGLGYKRRQGKDTLARFLYEHCGAIRGNIITIDSFARPLKQEANDAFRRLLLGHYWIDIVKTMKYLAGLTDVDKAFMQEAWEYLYAHRLLLTGQEELDEDVVIDKLAPLQWGDPLCPYGKCVELLQWWGTEYRRSQDPQYWIHRIERMLAVSTASVVILPDCRFPNEAEMITRNGGEVWCVEREGFTDETALASHASENALKDWPFDKRITAATLEELAAKGIAAFEERVQVKIR